MGRAVRHDTIVEEVVQPLFGSILEGGEFWVRVCETPVTDPFGGDGFHVAAIEIPLKSSWMLCTQIGPMRLHPSSNPIAHNHFVNLRAWRPPSLLHELVVLGHGGFLLFFRGPRITSKF